MVGRAETHLLRKREAQDQARLGIVRKALSGCAVDKRIQIGNPPQRLAGNGDRECMIRRRKLAFGGSGSVEGLAPPKNRIEHLERRPAGTQPVILWALNAWHRGLECAS
jgi:hypothetical protein